MKNYAVQSDGNVDRNVRIIKAFEALGVKNVHCLVGVATRGTSYMNEKGSLLNPYTMWVSGDRDFITLEELEELAYNLPKEGDEVWAWDDDINTKAKRLYLGVFKDWHMVQGPRYPIPYKNIQKINPNEEKIKELEDKIKELQKELEELKK